MVKSIVGLFSRLHREEEGQGIVEYMLLIVFVALAATAGMNTFASQINVLFSSIASKVNAYV